MSSFVISSAVVAAAVTGLGYGLYRQMRQEPTKKAEQYMATITAGLVPGYDVEYTEEKVAAAHSRALALVKAKEEELYELTGIRFNAVTRLVGCDWSVYDSTGKCPKEGEPAIRINLLADRQPHLDDVVMKFAHDIGVGLDQWSLSLFMPPEESPMVETAVNPPWLSQVLEAQQPDDVYKTASGPLKTLLWSVGITPVAGVDFHEMRRRCLADANKVHGYGLTCTVDQGGQSFVLSGGFNTFFDAGKEQVFVNTVKDTQQALAAAVGDTNTVEPVISEGRIFYWSKSAPSQ